HGPSGHGVRTASSRPWSPFGSYGRPASSAPAASRSLISPGMGGALRVFDVKSFAYAPSRVSGTGGGRVGSSRWPPAARGGAGAGVGGGGGGGRHAAFGGGRRGGRVGAVLVVRAGVPRHAARRDEDREVRGVGLAALASARLHPRERELAERPLLVAAHEIG